MAQPIFFQLFSGVMCGPGALADLPGQAKRLEPANGRVVIVCDPGVRDAGLAEGLTNPLAEKGFEPMLTDRVRSDPRAADIDAIAELIRTVDPGLVIGLGGGSALDTAKQAAVSAEAEDGVEAYALRAKPFPARTRPMIMVPTTAGTGAEVTRTVVFSSAEDRKVWTWGQELAPELAVLDPALTVGLPPELTAATGLDALVHAVEAATNQRTNQFIIGLCLQAVRLIAANLRTAVEEPESMAAREAMMIAACLGGMAIDGVGTGLAHTFGHALGTVAKVHHGRGVIQALTAIHSWNAEAAPSIHAEIARALGVPETGLEEAAMALAGAEALDELTRSVGFDPSPRADGLGPENLDELLAACLAEENATIFSTSCRVPDEEDLRRLAGIILER